MCGISTMKDFTVDTLTSKEWGGGGEIMTVLQDFLLSFSPAFIFCFPNQTTFPSLILLSMSFAHGIKYTSVCCHGFFFKFISVFHF